MGNFTLRTTWSVDKPTENNRVYSKADMKAAIDAYLMARDFGTANRGGYLADVAKPGQFHFPLAEMTHIVTDLRLEDDGHIAADLNTLSTPCGVILEQLLTDAPEFFILHLLMVGRLEPAGDATANVVDIRIDGVNVIGGRLLQN